MPFKPNCLPAAVGSLPHTNPQDALELLLHHFPEIPAWPQLPNCGFLESMYAQFSEGMPYVKLDFERERLYMDLAGDIYAELEGFYTRVLAEEIDYFAMTAEYARGFGAFIDRLWRCKFEEISWVKGQITGPISFGLMITDQRKRAVIYHEEVFDAVLKTLAFKARWQVRQLKRLHPAVIVFIDEPYLSSFGSAFINLTRAQVLQYIGEIIEAIHLEGALAGVHCCGNTDWSILMDTDIDIINFDAYEYFQGMTLYIDQLKAYFGRGKVLAWGIIPTSNRIHQESAESLVEAMLSRVDQLRSRGLSKKVILQQSLITPSCGMGSMRIDQAELVLQRLSEVSQTIRDQMQKQNRKKAV
ncbi:MAG: hypothetical protein NTW14_08245 [bacterium]|nr:hypothetical protein [bacterium]